MCVMSLLDRKQESEEGNGGGGGWEERTAGVMKLHIRMLRVNVGVKMGNGSDSPGSLSSSCSITDLLSAK